tara:strand:+ start:18794 stop:19126 length:333 start_codon:yes stop_codon:yes gene_type:complete
MGGRITRFKSGFGPGERPAPDGDIRRSCASANMEGRAKEIIRWTEMGELETKAAALEEDQGFLHASRERSNCAILRQKNRECHELCVSGLAHAGFRYGYALMRSSNIMAN